MKGNSRKAPEITEPGTPGPTRRAASANPWAETLRRLFERKAATAGLIIFILICLACVMAPLLSKWDYSAIDPEHRLEAPSAGHILGTDNLGRDTFTRILYGGRSTLKIALLSTVLAAATGGVIGLAAGYFGKRTDFFLSHILDMLASIPVFLLIIIAEAALGWGRGNFMFAMAIAAIPQFARLVRASVMTVAECEYIEASRALGVSHTGIILRRILHNIAPPLIVRFTSGVAEALMLCTIMGYLGVGINPPAPEWGSLAYMGRNFIRLNPMLIVYPCAAIAVCVISLSLFGDGLRDALEPA